MKRERAAVTAVMILAVVLRVYAVVRFPFEQDELYTIDEATNLFHTRLLPGIQARPFFFLLEHPFMQGFPLSEWYVRLLPLLFGITGVWVTWRLARQLAGPIAGFIALVLVTVSPWHLYVSGFARYYSLLYLLAALVYWRLTIAYDSDRRNDYLAVLVPLFLGTWTHPSFVFPVLGIAGVITILQSNGSVGFRWPSRNAWTWLWIPFVGLSAVVALAITLVHRSANVANGGDRGLLATLRLIPAMIDWMTIVVAVAALAGVILLTRSESWARRRFGWMAISGSVFTLVALFVLSFRTAIYADYGVAALPLVLIAASFPAAWLAENLPPARASAGVAVLASILVIGILPSTFSHLSDGTRFDYRSALSHINATDASLEVLTWPIAVQRAYAPNLHSIELPTTSSGLDKAVSTYHDVWAVISVKRYGVVGDDTGDMARWLWHNCREQEQYQRPRLDYRIYRVELWRCTAGE